MPDFGSVDIERQHPLDLIAHPRVVVSEDVDRDAIGPRLQADADRARAVIRGEGPVRVVGLGGRQRRRREAL